MARSNHDVVVVVVVVVVVPFNGMVIRFTMTQATLTLRGDEAKMN